MHHCIRGGSKAFPVATDYGDDFLGPLLTGKEESTTSNGNCKGQEISVPEFIGLDRYSFSFLLHNSALPS